MKSAPLGTHNPWTTISSREVYQNPWIRVREDQVIRPDKKPGIYGVIETPVATGVVALTDKLEVAMVGQYRYPTCHYSWEIIEGAAHKNENPIDAVRRELKEEAGIVARQVLQLGAEVHLSNCMTNEVALLYVAWGLTETSAAPEGTEVLTVKLVPFNEALALVRGGEIKDAMTVIAIERAEHWLKSRPL